MGKTFYVFDADVLSGSLSKFEKVIPWDYLHLSGNQNTLAVYYVSGMGQVGVTEVELLLDSRVVNTAGGFAEAAAGSHHTAISH